MTLAILWPQSGSDPPSPGETRASPPQARPLPRPGPRLPRPFRIMVVEDNRDVAEAMSWILEAEGAQVEWAPDGERALDAMGRFRPDAVLLDLGLPGISGHEVARRLRLGGFLGPMIVMTGFDGIENRLRSREVGVDHHLVKPVDPNQVLRLLGMQG